MLRLTLLTLCLSVVGTGCPSFSHTRGRATVVPRGETLTAATVSHTFQLAWAGSDLASLLSLSVAHTGAIEVMSSPFVSELSLFLQVDADEGAEEAVAAFENRIRSGSSFSGAKPSIVIPADEPHVFARELLIVLPQTPTVRRLELTLSWGTKLTAQEIEAGKLVLKLPASGSAELKRVRANLMVQGGGPQASLMADTLLPGEDRETVAGDLIAHVAQVAKMQLAHVSGKVILYVDHPEGADVTLDGTPIRDFPYPSP